MFVPADPKSNPRPRMLNTALHEGAPGHHLERSLAAELKDLPVFRRRMGVTAFTEGWANYAADTIGAEMGLYSEPYARYGLLAGQLLLANAIATDTGIHSFSWTRERAADLWREMVGTDPDYSLNRVTVWPAQIMSYSVGAEVIRQLREESKVAQGDRFDVREFHDLVPRDGALPLDLVEQRVRAHYAARSKN